MRKTSGLNFASNSKKDEEFESLRLFSLFFRAIVTFPALRHGRLSLFPIEHPRPPADALKDRDDRLSFIIIRAYCSFLQVTKRAVKNRQTIPGSTGRLPVCFLKVSDILVVEKENVRRGSVVVIDLPVRVPFDQRIVSAGIFVYHPVPEKHRSGVMRMTL